MGRTRGRQKGTTPRRRKAQDEDLPEAYRELLTETLSSAHPDLGEEGRTLKKRRVGGKIITEDEEDGEHIKAEEPHVASIATIRDSIQQTAYDDSSDSEDSDEDFEDVDLGKTEDLAGGRVPKSEVSPQDELKLVLGGKHDGLKSGSRRTRKPLTSSERKLRLEVHKMHVLCLLSHVHLRNHWCNNAAVQNSLRRLLSAKAISYLIDDKTQSQFQRNRSLVEGLEMAIESFRHTFDVSARGMERAYWADADGAQQQVPDDIDLPTQKSDFLQYAKKLSASRDIGAQLFCSMLRSVGMDARLVCSLQPLPFALTAKSISPVKQRPAVTVHYPETRTFIGGNDNYPSLATQSLGQEAEADASEMDNHSVRSKLARRFGGPPITQNRRPSAPPLTNTHSFNKRIRESPYPVYWVEVFDAAYQKWICVDPLVTKNTINKPSRLEPPANDPRNNLVYVVAFEDDGSARDVTRRYAKAYNAKTRKARVESTKGGERWWKKVMRIYRRHAKLVRDQIEDTELSAKEAAEEMPHNVQDFKDHPYYALERHLKKNEVIHPRQEIGKVATGKGSVGVDKDLEPIFRRRDVHVVKSADSWYRLGREIKEGEQPLKRAAPRKKHQLAAPSDDEASEEDGEYAGRGMYAGFQTVVYQAPPVVRGRVPKNQYGNIDVYVPTMIPPGAIHILHPETARAARLLEVDYADAVTGFQFKGRHGTAITTGAVVPSEFEHAIKAVLRGFHDEKQEADDMRRSYLALRYWKRFLVGLQIRDRIEGYEVEGDNGTHNNTKEAATIEETYDADEMDETNDYEAGGFFPDQETATFAEPTVRRFPQDTVYEDHQNLHLEDMDIESEREDQYVRTLGKGRDMSPAREHRYTSDEIPVEDAAPLWVEGGGFVQENTLGKDVPERSIPAARGYNEMTDNTESRSGSDVSITRHQNDTSDGNRMSFDNSPNETTTKAPEHREGEDISETPLHAVAKEGLEESQRTPQIQDLERPGLAELSESRETEMPNAIQDAAAADSPADSTQGSPNDEESVSGETSAVSDMGSLLSHDPEDEDADPDWLM